MGRVRITSAADIARARALKLAHPDWSVRHIKDEMSTAISMSHLHRIVYNLEFVDANYHPIWVYGARPVKHPRKIERELLLYHKEREAAKSVPVVVLKPRKEVKMREFKQNHMASIDSPFVCPTCGMGCETRYEADRCCRVSRLVG